MKKYILPALGMFAVLLIGWFILFAPKANDYTNINATTNTTSTDSQEAASTATAGSYQDYAAEAVANTSGKRILFFHAKWCPQCNALDASIRSGQIPSGTTIFKVDYDSQQDLRKQYGVTIQTTLVQLDNQGNLANKYVAYNTPSLDAVLNNLP